MKKVRKTLASLGVAAVLAVGVSAGAAAPAEAKFNPDACIAVFGINWQHSRVDRNGQIWRAFGWSWPWESQK